MMLAMAKRSWLSLVVMVLLVVALSVLATKWMVDSPLPDQPTGSVQTQDRAAFVGPEVCAECHQEEYLLWRGSHHDLAMQVADEGSVLGDFEGTRFRYAGITSTFFKRDGNFWVAYGRRRRAASRLPDRLHAGRRASSAVSDRPP